MCLPGGTWSHSTSFFCYCPLHALQESATCPFVHTKSHRCPWFASFASDGTESMPSLQPRVHGQSCILALSFWVYFLKIWFHVKRDGHVLLCHKTNEPIRFQYAKELGRGSFTLHICIFIQPKKLCMSISYVFVGLFVYFHVKQWQGDMTILILTSQYIKIIICLIIQNYFQ